jgi:hypothetical protein
VARAALEFVTFLLHPPKCWNYRHMPHAWLMYSFCIVSNSLLKCSVLPFNSLNMLSIVMLKSMA